MKAEQQTDYIEATHVALDPVTQQPLEKLPPTFMLVLTEIADSTGESMLDASVRFYGTPEPASPLVGPDGVQIEAEPVLPSAHAIGEVIIGMLDELGLPLEVEDDDTVAPEPEEEPKVTAEVFFSDE